MARTCLHYSTAKMAQKSGSVPNAIREYTEANRRVDELIVYEQESAAEGETSYWFVHTHGDLITACLDRDLALVHFAESAENISSDHFDVYANQAAQLPLSYTLTARKPAHAPAPGV